MEVKPHLQEVLDKFQKLNSLSLEHLDAVKARQLPELREAVCGVIQDHAAKRLMAGYIEGVKSTENILMTGVDGAPILARVYRPQGHGPQPVLLYFHGGGWVISNLNSYDATCRALCNAAECIVVSVGYRQGPENKYPSARDDAFAAYKWLLKNVSAVGGDVYRIAIAGESAGANLATVVCMMAKDQGLRLPVHQALIYPVTDCDFETPSYIEHANAKPLNREMMKWFFKNYFEDVPVEDAYAFPLLAQSLTGLPPATVITAEIDPLSSEGEAYAEKLREFGVPVSFKCYEGVTHEFFGMGAVLLEAKEAVRDVAENLQNAFDDAYASSEMGASISIQELRSSYLRETTYF